MARGSNRDKARRSARLDAARGGPATRKTAKAGRNTAAAGGSGKG